MAKNRRRKERSKLTLPETPPCTCDNGTVAKCRVCNVDMCESCFDVHINDPKTKSHDFVRQDVALCMQHLFEAKRFYCEQCEDLYCGKCLNLYHQGHKSLNFTNVIKTKKKVIDWLLVKCEAKIPQLNGEVQRFKVLADMTEKNAEETKQNIDCHFKELITALEEKQLQLMEEVETVKLEKLKQIYYEQENVTMAIARLNSGIEFTKQATKSGNEKEFMSMRKQILERLEELSATEISKSALNARWDVHLHSPFSKANADSSHFPLVNEFAIRADTVMFDFKMMGGEDGMMYATFKNQSRKFVITLKDKNCATLALSGKDVQVAIRLPSINVTDDVLHYEDIKVIDNNDSTYYFTYRPKIQGLYYLRITVDGKLLTDDFEWTVEAPLGFGNKRDKRGSIRLYPPSGRAPTWNRFIGGKYSWKIQRTNYKETTEVRVGVMMEMTKSQWGWCNGKREETHQLFVEEDVSFSNISSWLENEELTFFNDDDSGLFIIYHEGSGEREVFQRIAGTAARPYVYPASYDIFSLDSKNVKKHSNKIHVNTDSKKEENHGAHHFEAANNLNEQDRKPDRDNGKTDGEDHLDGANNLNEQGNHIKSDLQKEESERLDHSEAANNSNEQENQIKFNEEKKNEADNLTRESNLGA